MSTAALALDNTTWLIPCISERESNSIPVRKDTLFRERNEPHALIIEREATARVAMTEILTSYGVRVHSVPDGAEACRLVEKERFEGIFLTLPLDGCDSVELIRKIRLSWWNANSPVVVLGTSDSARAMSQAAVAGGTISAHKPMDGAALLRMMKVAHSAILLERRRLCRPAVFRGYFFAM